MEGMKMQILIRKTVNASKSYLIAANTCNTITIIFRFHKQVLQQKPLYLPQ